jgi:hypothetical protein
VFCILTIRQDRAGQLTYISQKNVRNITVLFTFVRHESSPHHNRSRERLPDRDRDMGCCLVYAINWLSGATPPMVRSDAPKSGQTASTLK